MFDQRDPLLQSITAALTPTMSAGGFVLVLARLIGGQNRPTLQLMVERADGGRVNLDECAQISRQCSAVLDVENAIDGAFVLEVSSPGIDRPLTRIEDFSKFGGEQAKIETHVLIEGRKRFNGLLGAVDADGVQLQQDGNWVHLPFAQMVSAKLDRAAALLAPKPKPGKKASG